MKNSINNINNSSTKIDILINEWEDKMNNSWYWDARKRRRILESLYITSKNYILDFDPEEKTKIFNFISKTLWEEFWKEVSNNVLNNNNQYWNTEDLKKFIWEYKNSLKELSQWINEDYHNARIPKIKKKIIEIISTAISNQNVQMLKEARGLLANLAPLADHFDSQWQKWDSLRLFWEITNLFLQNNRPLEQLKLCLPKTKSGKLLLYIKYYSWKTLSELISIIQKNNNNFNKELKKILIDEFQKLYDSKLVVTRIIWDRKEILLSKLAIKNLNDLYPDN